MYSESLSKTLESLGAVEGCRDDRHITRAIGVWICYNELKPINWLLDQFEEQKTKVGWTY